MHTIEYTKNTRKGSLYPNATLTLGKEYKVLNSVKVISETYYCILDDNNVKVVIIKHNY